MHTQSITGIRMKRSMFLSKSACGLGGIGLASLLKQDDLNAQSMVSGLPELPHFAPKAKRVIYLFQSGAPSQIELLDYKPLLNTLHGSELPDSVRQGQRLTGMTAGQTSFTMVGSKFPFKQHGQAGTWTSNLLPHLSRQMDEICVINSMHTEAINHDPAATFLQTGSPFPGRPAIGSWIDYGLGSENENLPAFIVMITKERYGQPLYARLWGNGFLPSRHQGVQFRGGKDPVLYLNNPPGLTVASRRTQLDMLAEMHKRQSQQFHAPEIMARVAQYEMAFRMQSSVPELTDLSNEPKSIFNLYGQASREPGTFAANCLLARRMAERGVRFIQLYHRGWDQHDDLPAGIQRQCMDTDQACAALITDLKQRGLLEETLVVWGGEFGRTNYSQGALTHDNYGRDHHPKCFSVWMAGGGIQGGMTYGKTDAFSYNIVENPVHVHDFQATLMHLLGIHHTHFTFKFQGRRFRLTDVHGNVIQNILA
jgi:hypothetical protein